MLAAKNKAKTLQARGLQEAILLRGLVRCVGQCQCVQIFIGRIFAHDEFLTYFMQGDLNILYLLHQTKWSGLYSVVRKRIV